MYCNLEELFTEANRLKTGLWRPVLDNEIRLSELSEEQVLGKLDARLSVMQGSAGRALEHPCATIGGLIDGVAARQYRYAETQSGLCGGLLNRVMARALSCSEVNASMGRICAAPTAGACGILPAVLLSVGEKLSLSREQLVRGLLTASGVGAVIMKNATVSGAEGGCQAECGTAAAMAAAAAVEMAGGTPGMALHAAAFALMNTMGLVCDPVAGLVQVPCAQRNALQAVAALGAADLALAGMESVIPADQVIDAMLRVGRSLPMQLRETALGGVADTPAGREIAQRIFEDN
ncbi:MAG: L-serine ammonia-lyase, iron-sulfur-dependent, subunit alpha, partial [Oscillospiraceae bacterium]